MLGAIEAKSGQGLNAHGSRTHEGRAPHLRAFCPENPFTTAKGKNFSLLEPRWKTTPFPRETREKEGPEPRLHSAVRGLRREQRAWRCRTVGEAYFFDSSFEMRSE